MKALLIGRESKIVLGIIDVEDAAHLDLIMVGDCIKVMHDDIVKSGTVLQVGDHVATLLEEAAKLADGGTEPAFVRILRALGIKG